MVQSHGGASADRADKVTDQPTPIALMPDTLDGQVANFQSQLDDLRQQLTESQRLATIGTLAAVIAHEFNNLLTPIVSYCQFALTSAEGVQPDMDLVRKALGKSFQSATKAGKICSSLLALARGESSTGVVAIQTVVNEVLQVMARDPQKDGLALRVQVAPGLTVEADAVQIEQVLLNLLINARHAMLGRAGSLTIKAGLSEDSTEVRLQVIDTGPGIPEKLLPRIFEPFFTTKGTAKRGQAKGTGLGLSISKDIIERHGGRITVHSEVGRGTTFTIHLPATSS